MLPQVVFHGSSGLFIFQELPGQQALHLHTQNLGQAGEQGDVRTALAALPFGHRLVTHRQPLG